MNSLDQGKYWLGALSIQPKIPVISVGTSNGTDHFGLFRPEYSGPALKVVHRDPGLVISVGRTEKKVCEIKLQLYKSPWESAYYLSETCRRFLTKAIYQLSWNDYNKAWLNTNWLKHRIHLPYSSRNCFKSFEYRKIPKISSSMYKPLQI